MDVQALRATLKQEAPPSGLGHALAALWWDAKGDWDKAHTEAQKDPGPMGCAVHAYLHRVEGDLSNAGYWYNRAGRAPVADPLPVEWEALARELLAGR
jgi:hypothetical protein